MNGVDRRLDLLPDGPNGKVDSSHQHERLEAGERIPRTVGMDRAHGAVMPGVPAPPPQTLEPPPKGEYGVETKVSVSVPKDGCCFNYAQGGLVIYGNDENYVTLTDLSNWDTRITEFAVAMKPTAADYPFSGSTQVGPPGDWTWLRILKRSSGNEELYRAYTSADGITWERGGVWTHRLGAGTRIGLVAMAASGFTVHFGYVHVYALSK